MDFGPAFALKARAAEWAVRIEEGLTMSAATKSLLVLIAFLAVIPTRVAVAADATLYELSEEMSLKAGFRLATSSFQGTAELGTPLCPLILADLLAKAGHPIAIKSCTVSGVGSDEVDLAYGTGKLWGSFAVVVNADNFVDAPEYVVMTGTFKAGMVLTPSADLTGKRQSLGPATQRILLTDGTFTPENVGGLSPKQLAAYVMTGTPDPTGLDEAYLAGVVNALGVGSASFSGVFRLPFSVSKGQKEKPRRDRGDFYYLSDKGTLIKVRRDETALGYPTVRIEVTFGR